MTEKVENVTITAQTKKSEAAVAAQHLKAALLDLLQHDDDIKLAVMALASEIGGGTLGGSDAEMGQNVLDLIERHVRPDALRRAPAYMK